MYTIFTEEETWQQIDISGFRNTPQAKRDPSLLDLPVQYVTVPGEKV